MLHVPVLLLMDVSDCDEFRFWYGVVVTLVWGAGFFDVNFSTYWVLR